MESTVGMIPQYTIGKEISLQGVNVFTGRRSNITFIPNEPGRGLEFFYRGERIPANLEAAMHDTYVSASFISVVGQRRVRKVEHVLSALYALGIDNVLIDCPDGAVPRFPHGVSAYIAALERERQMQQAEQPVYQPKKRFLFKSTSAPDSIEIGPLELTQAQRVEHSPFYNLLTYTAYYPHKAIGFEQITYDFTLHDYKTNFMHARAPFFLPFGLHALKHAVARRGLDESNCVFVGRKSDPCYIMNSPVRNKEFVQHKVIDALGAIALLRRRFAKTEFLFHMTGHKFDLQALQRLEHSGLLAPAYQIVRTT